MLFNSYIFWLFYLIVFLSYRALNHRWQNRMLLVASYVFYGTWDWRFLFLLFGTTVMDYFVALGIDAAPTQRRRFGMLLISIVANLTLLGFFKYYDFFAVQLSYLLTSVGIHASLPLLHVILPVGISFYTFQELSYTVDVYRGHTKPVRHFLDFALYVAFFPQLVAGPIERSSRLIPQILAPRPRREDDFSVGAYLVLSGLFRKVVIADNMASITQAVFTRSPADLTGAECLMGIYAFALQVYGDFSGYSAIARGVARWMGFDLMANFRQPYLAVSPSDFWQRWHISLSTWLRDYLYIPLGGNRGGTWKTYRNLLLTMFIGGLWHGANWTFIAWGVYHGLLLCLWRPFERAPTKGEPIKPRTLADLRSQLLRAFVMFHLVCFGWLLFRADSLTQVGGMLRQMFTNFHWTPGSTYSLSMILVLAGPFLLYELWVDWRDDLLALTRAPWFARGLVYAYLILMMQIFPAELAHAFIYFQF